MIDNNQQAFFALLRAGLWEKEARLLSFGEIDFSEVLRLAEEQSVVGLVAAGLEHVVDIKVPKVDFLTFVGRAVQLEQQNSDMNQFVEKLVQKMQTANIYTLLVKGQGIAQCYERPLWRTPGDIDLFMSDENYTKAKSFLTSIASHVDPENVSSKHLGMTINSWVVELHGSMCCGLSTKIDKGLDEIKHRIFHEDSVRSWINDKTQVFLPRADEDAVYVFTHILEHFYKGGIGIRQICDWSRLLWTYRDNIDKRLLEKRLNAMGLISEWKAFGVFAVEYLGMPAEAMPLYSSEKKWTRKGDKICAFVMEVGNFGHNRDNSYYGKYPYVIRKTISLGRRLNDLFRHACIFPMDSLRFFPNLMFNGLRSAIKGEG